MNVLRVNGLKDGEGERKGKEDDEGTRRSMCSCREGGRSSRENEAEEKSVQDEMRGRFRNAGKKKGSE